MDIPRSELIKKLPFWDRLTEDEKKLVSGSFLTREYAPGELIRARGESCLGMVYVLSGEVRICIVSPEGREITLFRLHPGDTCVVSASCVLSQITFETQMAAAEATELMIVSPGTFSWLTDCNIHVRCYMYELAAERFSAAMWVLQQILFARFDQRLATFLYGEYERTGEREIRLTQEQIAENVNSAREVVARMLKHFASDGIIELHRGSIRLLDTEALKELII